MRLGNPLLDPRRIGSLKRVVDSIGSMRSFEDLGIAQTVFHSAVKQQIYVESVIVDCHFF